MENQALNEVVERLLADRRFLQRFRLDPEGTLRRYGLSPQAVEAVKRGDADELLALGLSPELVSPAPRPESGSLRSWLLRRGHRLAPAVFAAALLCALPAQAAAARTPGMRIAKWRVAASSRRALYPHALYPHALYPHALYPHALYPHKRVLRARAARLA
jgi:hypothetical protein